MTHYRYDYAVFIGRFQPFHKGHAFVCERALSQARQLIILIGSSGNARSLRNPFSFEERKAWILASLPSALAERVIIQPIYDYTYNDTAWTKAVTHQVKTVTEPDDVVALVGHDKDASTYYLALFPEWGFLEVGNLEGINATALRLAYFKSQTPEHFSHDALLAPTQQKLREFSTSDTYQRLKSGFDAITAFKSQWQGTPYPVIFTTTDALVTYKKQLLVIRRKHYPGKGLLALPGGFLDAEETLINGCIRELVEETQLDVSKKTLLSRLNHQAVFDDPKRSERGRTITYCYHFDLSNLAECPAVLASDDAEAAFWMPFAQLSRRDFFEDHFFIIHAMLNLPDTLEPEL